ncbi:glycosyltransferase [Sulfurimonas sp.]|uniref:glycosyltransferase n=1 Tax=Sulfurimonas sp. TaxID=2022749 RepID=UPI003D0BE476
MDITVVIPSLNRYHFLKRAVKSVLVQSYPPKEIIVVDDGSNDQTAQIQKDFPQLKYIYQENQGVSAARNVGIKNANYEWIAFLDSDDTFHSKKLEEQCLFHKNNPEILMSYTDEVWIRDDQKVKIPKKFQKIGKDVFMENLSYCNIAPSSVLIHKKIFNQVGYFDESLEVCEDYDLWLRVALDFEIALLPKKLITKYAGHDDQLSFKHWGMDRFRVVTLEKLLQITKQHQKIEIIKLEAQKKYNLLLEGAIKYDKIQSIQYYKEKIEQLNKRN